MSSVVGAALPLLAPQSFAQGTLERRVAFTKDAGFLQTVTPAQSMFWTETSTPFLLRNAECSPERAMHSSWS